MTKETTSLIAQRLGLAGMIAQIRGGEPPAPRLEGALRAKGCSVLDGKAWDRK